MSHIETPDTSDALASARARELAFREILGIISHSTDDEQPVLDAIVRHAGKLCGASFAALFLLDESRTYFKPMAYLGGLSTYSEMASRSWELDEMSVQTLAILKKRPFHVPDIAATDAYKSGYPLAVASVDTEGMRTLLTVPLLNRDTAIGTINLYHREVKPFTDDQIELVKVFAEHAVVAVEKVRQFREVQKRLDREKATAEILHIISTSHDDEQPVFEAISQYASTLCEAPFAALLLVDDAETNLQIRAHVGPNARPLDQVTQDWPLDQPSAMSISVREGRPVQFKDLVEHPGYKKGHAPTVKAVELDGIRTFVAVPLLDGARAIGTIGLYRTQVKPFSDDEIALVETFADQAVIAVKKVQQFREVQTRLEREQASREILEVISQSRDDEKPVFQAILSRAERLCGAQTSGLQLVDPTGAQLILAATSGADGGNFTRGALFPMSEENNLTQAIREKRPIHAENLKASQNYLAGEPKIRKLVDQDGVQTQLVVPLLGHTEAIGTMTLSRLEQRPFTADQIALVETFAAQAVIAIENVRQFREVQKRLEREEASRDILQVINASQTDPAPVFDTILKNAVRLSGAPSANLCLLNDARSHWKLVAHVGEGLRYLVEGKSTTFKDSKLVPAVSMRTAKVVHIGDLTDTDLYRQRDPGRVAMVEVEGMRTIVGVPLLRGSEAIGCITLFRRETKPFTPDEIALVETFAAQAVIAIENMRQFSEVQERLERERATSRVLQVISESREGHERVFDVLLQETATLLKSEHGSVWLVSEDGQWLEVVARAEHGAEIGAAFDRRRLNESGSIVAQVVSNAEVWRTEDLQSSPAYADPDHQNRVWMDQSGARSILVVPLISGKGAIGAVAVYRCRVDPYTEDQVALLETFAAQAVIAIENVRQFQEVQERLEREAATAEVLRVISQSRDDEQPVFEVILNRAAQLCDASTTSLLLANETGDLLVMKGHAGPSLSLFDEARTSFKIEGNDFPVRAFRSGQVFHVSDMSQVEEYVAGDPDYVRLAEEMGDMTYLSVPLIKDGTPIGVIDLFRQESRPFADSHIALIQSFADQAVIAIENVRQFKALEALNAQLGDRVEEQVGEIERMGRLKRFLPSAVADVVMSEGADTVLRSKRSLVAVLFCDIRGFTTFVETAEPEETIDVLQTYQQEMGKLIAVSGAGFDQRFGDGFMVVFNAPLPIEDPAGDAVRLAIAMRARMAKLCKGWKRLGHKLGFGVGVSLGYVTAGMVGDGERYEYAVSGTAVNLAARLCDQAEDGDILLSPRAQIAVEDDFAVESCGERDFKGIRHPVEVFRVSGAAE